MTVLAWIVYLPSNASINTRSSLCVYIRTGTAVSRCWAFLHGLRQHFGVRLTPWWYQPYKLFGNPAKVPSSSSIGARITSDISTSLQKVTNECRDLIGLSFYKRQSGGRVGANWRTLNRRKMEARRPNFGWGLPRLLIRHRFFSAPALTSHW